MVVGGIVLFDEYSDPPWPDCNQAVDEFLSDAPEKLQMLQMNNYQKWYLVKQDLQYCRTLSMLLTFRQHA
jgi:hypothetical protein